ncbi:Lethal(2) giant larvae protein 1 [Clonorchis sinensis]|uniref:Lethal(2) giant larvae protein 1 n=1 Tax=Clonorchis sinensis TaxID=79923 RepID=A0A8T1N0D2_CLOSI|nr:Lethal(2) giant larvae protein 1 [Clonorchis sinensis]
MAQKFLEPFRKLPHQIQNLHLIQKLQGLTLSRGSEAFGLNLPSAYGCVDSPSAIAFDDKLGLFAVASKTGCIKVYGTPGVVLTVKAAGCAVLLLSFLPEEGRLLAALETGYVSLYELNPKNGHWVECAHVRVLFSDQEQITALALGHGIVYIGSSTGTLYQVAISNGRLSPGDHSLTSCTSSMVSESVPVDKREQLGVDSPIVSLQLQPEGNHLLIAYAGGCVAVAIPQTIPENVGTESVPTADVTPSAPTAEQEATTPIVEEPGVAMNEQQTSAEGGSTHEVANPESESADAASASAQPSEPTQQHAPATPAKESSERRTTIKLKEFTRSLRRLDLTKPEVEAEPPLPVPPPPRISHLLLRDQPVEWASWRVTASEVQSNEITVAYGDGAYQIWPITAAATSEELLEPIIVAKRDPPTTPYGPLPCGAIKKIIQHPGVSGGVITAFSGGLPRAEFNDRHAVSVLQDPEHHVCFQFGSPVKDFLFIPQKSVKTDEVPAVTEAPVSAPCTPQSAIALLVMTERELVVIDLQQPNWPTFQSPYLNCLDISPVTAVTHLSKVSSALLSRLRTAVKCAQTDVTHSQWPIWGGENCNESIDLAHNDGNDVVVLGHANGWITLLAIGRGDSVHRLGTFHTDSLFNLSDSPNGLLTASATPNSITLVVGGCGGQVSVWTANEENKAMLTFEPDVSRIHVNLIEQDAASPRYIWNGLAAMKPFEGVTQVCDTAGTALYPCALIQLDPPAPITAVALEPSWHLLALGSPHGFAVVDLLAKSAIYTDFLFAKSPITTGGTHRFSRHNQVSAMQTAIVNRGKQITASVRQSFRRLKHLRTSTTKAPEETQEAAPSTQPTEQPVEGEQPKDAAAEPTLKPEETASPEPTLSQDVPKPEPTEESAPVEPGASQAEQVAETPSEPTSLSADEFGPSTVRFLLFADTYVVSAVPATAQHSAVPSPRTPSIWVGTMNGRVIAHSLSWEDTSGPVTVQLHKELQLQHRAPVIGLCVLDTNSRTPVSSSPRVRTGCELQPKPDQPEAEPKKETTKEEGSKEENESATAPAVTPAPTAAVPMESHQKPTKPNNHKHKFVERIRLPGHSSGATGTSSSNTTATGEATVSAPKSGDNAETTEHPEPAAEPETKPVAMVPQPHRKSLTAFGVQPFVRGTGEHSKTEWDVVVTRYDGQAVILSIPHLRKLFKSRSFIDPTIHPVPCVSSLTSTNLVFWHAGCQLILTELSSVPRLSSPALLTPGAPSPLQATVTLPEWARPREPAPAESEASKEPEAVVTEDVVTDAVVNGEAVNGTSEVQTTETMDSAAPLEEKIGSALPTGAPHAGDVTMDSIKEYLNGEGTVTIKTIETSSEKRTIVEGGQMVTTLHESERVDGKLIRDDVIKFSTDEPPALSMTEAV